MNVAVGARRRIPNAARCASPARGFHPGTQVFRADGACVQAAACRVGGHGGRVLAGECGPTRRCPRLLAQLGRVTSAPTLEGLVVHCRSSVCARVAVKVDRLSVITSKISGAE
jgi:hypothetical protein